MKVWYEITFVPTKRIKCDKTYKGKVYNKGKKYTVRRKLEHDYFLDDVRVVKIVSKEGGKDDGV